MKKHTVNPWTWQDQLGYSQAVVVSHATETLYAAGQGPLDAEGRLVGEGDLSVQTMTAMENVETVLAQAGMSLADVVRYELYTTDLQAYFVHGHQHVVKAFAEAGVAPAGGIATQVVALAVPGMEVEVTVTATR